MRFRIGINLGDVIQEKNRISGDGVNIAARLESLADPIGIAISGTALDNVRINIDCGYENQDTGTCAQRPALGDCVTCRESLESTSRGPSSSQNRELADQFAVVQKEQA